METRLKYKQPEEEKPGAKDPERGVGKLVRMLVQVFPGDAPKLLC
jgi:hypothetical protein